jgi:DNA-binding NarL/FixJ family response regulator
MESESSPEVLTRPVRLIIADDHYLVRSGYRSMLASEPDLEVVGEAENGKEAVKLCRELRPDLVLMDVRMPEMDGLEATRDIRGELPTTSILMVTTHENPEYLLEALRAGAAGYVLKDAPKRRLIDAIRRVANGETPLNQELAVRLIRQLADETKQKTEPPPEPEKRQEPSCLESLTPRELEVLRLLAQGQSNPQIAGNLVISRGTVKVHVQHIMAKLGVSDRTQAVVRAIDLGLLNHDSG